AIAGGGVEIEVAGGGAIEAEQEALADPLGVDGVVHRLAHPRVREPGPLLVPADEVVVGAVELDAAEGALQSGGLQIAHPLLRLQWEIEVELALLEQLEAEGGFGDEPVDDPVEIRLASPVLVVAHERDPLAGLPRLEAEGSGPHWRAVDGAV